MTDVLGRQRIFDEEWSELLEVTAELGGQHGRNSLVDVVQQLDLIAEAIPDMSEQAGHKAGIGSVGPGFGPAVGRHRLVPAGSG